jgi:hypothetical protein
MVLREQISYCYVHWNVYTESLPSSVYYLNRPQILPMQNLSGITSNLHTTQVFVVHFGPNF